MQIALCFVSLAQSVVRSRLRYVNEKLSPYLRPSRSSEHADVDHYEYMQLVDTLAARKYKTSFMWCHCRSGG